MYELWYGLFEKQVTGYGIQAIQLGPYRGRQQDWQQFILDMKQVGYQVVVSWSTGRDE